MTKLQNLITAELSKGKSYREIAEKSGINHVSLTQYHRDEVQPGGKNLAILAKYFGVDFWELIEDDNRDSTNRAGSSDDHEGEDRRSAVELRLLIDELKDLSPTEQLEWLLKIRKEKEARKLK